MMTEQTDEKLQKLARELAERPLAKRFYKSVSICSEGGSWRVQLDGRSVRTPMKNLLALPGEQIAEAVADEWRVQDDKIDPAAMPVTRLANTAIDRVRAYRAQVAGDVVNYAGSDLLCYRADMPAGLVARQTGAWDPVLEWAYVHLGERFVCTVGVVHLEQPKAALAAVAARLDLMDEFKLAAVHNFTTLTGSALLALALTEGGFQKEEIWAAAHVDEQWNADQWGIDAEAERMRKARWREFDATAEFYKLL